MQRGRRSTVARERAAFEPALQALEVAHGRRKARTRGGCDRIDMNRQAICATSSTLWYIDRSGCGSPVRCLEMEI